MKSAWLIALALLMFGGLFMAVAAEQSPEESRKAADAAVKKGNFNDAYKLYQTLATDPADGSKAPHDLTEGILCLNRLGRPDEIDDFREKVISVHAQNWRLLMAAAQSMMIGNENWGFIVAGLNFIGETIAATMAGWSIRSIAIACGRFN